MRKTPALLFVVVLAAVLTSPRSRAGSADAACMEDSCQMCITGGACFSQMLANCRHPMCFVLGMAGGTVGALAGGAVGLVVLPLPAMALYPDLTPTTALIASVLVGTGAGCAAGGVPGMLCGEMIGSSVAAGRGWWPFGDERSPKKRRRPRRKK